MPRSNVLEAIQKSGLVVVVNGVDPNVIEELCQSGVKIFERRFKNDTFYATVKAKMSELRSIVGEDSLVGAIGLRTSDQIVACSGPCDFFTPGSNGVRDELLRGLVKIGYCFGAEDVYRDNEVKPMRLYRYPGNYYVEYLAGLLDSFGHGHKLIVTPHNIWDGGKEIYRMFEAGAYAVEVNAKDIGARVDFAMPTSISKIVTDIFSMIKQGKAAYAQQRQQESEEK